MAHTVPDGGGTVSDTQTPDGLSGLTGGRSEPSAPDRYGEGRRDRGLALATREASLRAHKTLPSRSPQVRSGGRGAPFVPRPAAPLFPGTTLCSPAWRAAFPRLAGRHGRRSGQLKRPALFERDRSVGIALFPAAETPLSPRTGLCLPASRGELATARSPTGDGSPATERRRPLFPRRGNASDHKASERRRHRFLTREALDVR